MLSARNQIQYTLREKTIINKCNQMCHLAMEVLELENKVSIYPNQLETAGEIIVQINNREKIFIMVIGETQSGKTGIIYATIKLCLENSINVIPIQNTYIITGMSSIEWKHQTKARFPECLEARIFHQDELIRFSDDIKDKNNLLIFIDEVHMASKPGQTIYNALKNADFFVPETLYKKDIKIVEISATPDGTIHDLMKAPHASSKIIAKNGYGYISSGYLLRAGRIKQSNDLCGYNKKTGQVNPNAKENIQELKMDIDNYSVPKYHLVRTPCGSRQEITIDNFKQVFYGDSYNFIKHDADNKTTDDLNSILITPPEKHTIIFIKETIRCAKTLVQTHRGVSYERYRETPNDTTIIQGILGRETGYNDNGVSICYTNVPSINKYEKALASKFEDNTINWTSNTTMFKDGVLSGKNTFNNPVNFFSESMTIEVDEPESLEPVIRKFNTFLEGREYYNNELKESFHGRGPRTRSPDENGFILSTIGKEKMETRTRVRTYEELHHYRKWNLNETHKYTFYPYYEDITNNTTLKWVMFHY